MRQAEPFAGRQSVSGEEGGSLHALAAFGLELPDKKRAAAARDEQAAGIC